MSDLLEPDLPREFRADEDEELACRLALRLNAAQAALQCQQWSAAEQHATGALELEVSNRSLGVSCSSKLFRLRFRLLRAVSRASSASFGLAGRCQEGAVSTWIGEILGW